jgi:hypothetical protein
MTIKINGTNTTAQPSITGTDTDTGLVYGDDDVKIVTGGTERVKVDSSGKVGIGISSPIGKLTIADTTANTIWMTGRSADDTSSISFRNNADSAYIARIAADNSGALQFRGASSEAMRIDSSGAIVLPDGSPGIQFGTVSSPATSTNLDDYEEGTFTPTMKFGSSSAGMTFSVGPYANYTKIGRQVFIRVSFKFSNKGTSTGHFAITGLPFAAISLSGYQHPLGIAWLANSTAANRPIVPVVQTGAILIFRELNRTEADVAPTDVYFDNDTALMLSLSYETS